DFSSNPWVIKRDVLAGGKGVVVTADRDEAKEFISQSILSDDLVLLEDFLPGEEASMLVIMDESAAICLPPSQDHKRVGEGDVGLNTGGMGAYCPAPVVTEAVREKVMERIVGPMHIGLSSQVNPYRGVLYVGLMIDSLGDPYVVEFNVRFGDPECQVTLPLISSDVYLMLMSAAAGNLERYEARFSHGHCLTVVLAAEGYPGPPVKGREISGSGLSSTEEAWIIHAGTDLQDGKLVSTGGRVLSVTGYGSDLAAAALQACSVISEIELDGSHYRRDIGFRAL
nr:phosphoribosylamine--glycine ligase [Pseudomonadales bacterium]